MTRDLVGERVGLLQVLRGQQHGRAVVDQARGRRPTCPRAWPGRGRWSARRGRSPTAGRRGSRPGRAGGACRRSRSWRAGRRRRSGRTRSSSSAARGPRLRRVRSSSRPISTRFCVPVRSSSTEAYWPVRPIVCADLRRRRGPRRSRRRGRVPASGRSSVARMRTAVVLPAPLGPSTPSTVPAPARRGRRRPAPASRRSASEALGLDGDVHLVAPCRLWDVGPECGGAVHGSRADRSQRAVSGRKRLQVSRPAAPLTTR